VSALPLSVRTSQQLQEWMSVLGRADQTGSPILPRAVDPRLSCRAIWVHLPEDLQFRTLRSFDRISRRVS
jgi:hypothetical protein